MTHFFEVKRGEVHETPILYETLEARMGSEFEIMRRLVLCIRYLA